MTVAGVAAAGEDAAVDGEESVCKGCSVCVAVVGEDEAELASDGGELDAAEKYADVGVAGGPRACTCAGAGAVALTVCTVGRRGGEAVRGEVLWGGLALRRRLRRCGGALGLGLRELMREMGLVKPER